VVRTYYGFGFTLILVRETSRSADPSILHCLLAEIHWGESILLAGWSASEFCLLSPGLLAALALRP
jgi:hypothetical protein